ncbi:MAG: molybdopterin oxidoreductase family protein [Acidobacteria bacterium]|nr:MAG: molybdopterin oxidoreductase family protein [Acidobacteriota bacterium]
MPEPTRIHYRACNLCEAICGIAVEHRGDEILGIRGDREDPFSRGHVCPKAVALQDVHHDPDRLRHPLRRTAAGFERISWRAAFDEVGQRLAAIQRRYGSDAVAMYAGNPSVHNYGTMLFGPRLMRALKTRNRFSATSVDQLPHHLAAYLMFGHQLLLPIPDLDRTDFLLILGANPAVSNGSLMTAPDVKNRLKAIRRRGGTVVVVDPRRTRTAALADRHLFIRPGQDALLLAALLHTLFDEGLARPGRLAGMLDGLDRLAELVADFPAERVAAASGIDAPQIRRLARDFAAAPAAACYGRMGTSVTEFGGLCQWLINALNAVTGNLDREGGVMFTRPAVDVVGRPYGGGSYGRWRSRVRGLPEFAGELPVATLAEEILTPGEGRIRALVTSAGNPVLSTPNGRQLERALDRLDYMVAIDLYLNETTRHADVILPPTSALEHDHYDLVFNLLAVRNVARYSPPMVTPPSDARHDWQILLELESRLGRQGLRARLERAILRRLGPAGMLAVALRTGPYGPGWNPLRRGLTLGRLKKAPHGVDLGPLTPCLPQRLKTPERRIHLTPEPFAADVRRLRRHLERQTPPPFVLIGRRSVRSNNSWLHNAPRLMRGAERCTLWLHPDDAERLGVAGGDRVRLRSRVGAVEAPVEVTDRIMPGVVSLPHGWGHHRPGIRLRIAATRPGASINDLTDERRLDALSGNAAFSGVPVEIEAVVEAAAATPPAAVARA